MAPRPLPPQPQRRQPGRRRGIALIEALLAVLLLSGCALAYAALQMRGLAAGHSAMWRSKATLLAYEMADRMRANRAAVAAGHYNTLVGSAGTSTCGGSSACTPEAMAQLDYGQWSATLSRELPGGTGAVCLDASPDDGSAASPGCSGDGMLAVKVFWSERGQVARLAVGVRP